MLVTGGAGFIGAHLCRHLLGEGHEVVVIDDLSSGYRSNIATLDVEFHLGSIMDVAALGRAVRDVDTVVHLAARPSVPRSIEDPALTNNINVNGTMNVLIAARDRHSRVVFASSSSVYGANQESPKREDMRPQPVSPYAVSKLSGEAYTLAFQHVYDLGALAFRFFNVYGPLQSAGHAYAAVVPNFVGSLLSEEILTIHGDGMQSRDFTSVETVAAVLCDAVTRRVVSPSPVNLAFGTTTSLLDLVTMLEEITGRQARVMHGPDRVGDVRMSKADNDRLRGLFPSAVAEDLRTGLEKTVNWFESLNAHHGGRSVGSS